MGVPDSQDTPDLSESRNNQPTLSDYLNSNDDEMNEVYSEIFYDLHSLKKFHQILDGDRWWK